MTKEPTDELIITMAAWRRLYLKAQELDSKQHLAGAVILYYMSMAWDESEKDLEKAQKEIEKQIKRESKKEAKQ